MEIREVKLEGTKTPSKLFKEIIGYMAYKKEFKDIIVRYESTKEKDSEYMYIDKISLSTKNERFIFAIDFESFSNDYMDAVFKYKWHNIERRLISARDYLYLLDGKKKFVTMTDKMLSKEHLHVINTLKNIQKRIDNTRLYIVYRPTVGTMNCFNNSGQDCIELFYKVNKDQVVRFDILYFDIKGMTLEDITELLNSKIAYIRMMYNSAKISFQNANTGKDKK